MAKENLKTVLRSGEVITDPAVRERCGALSGGVGIALNLLLFAGKLTAGILSGAVSVTADAFNNLTDAASSVVTLVGFRLAGQRADADHPFGHGRIEYLAGLLVSLFIMLVGVELGESSVRKIFHPEQTSLTWVSGGILLVSIAVKLWMARFNRVLSRRIKSDTLAAAAADARSDAAATGAVLLGLVITRVSGVVVDGWFGLLVAAFILWSGFKAARDTLNPLLGTAPAPDEVRAIEQVILSHRQVVGAHDLIIHDYGPGRRMMSVHAEVASDANLLEVHDVIDHIERELYRRFGIESVIHVDPIQVGSPEVDALRSRTAQLAREISPVLTIHDFRVAAGSKRPTLVFDLVVPCEAGVDGEAAKRALAEKLAGEEGGWRAIIHVDHSHVL